MPNPIRSNLSSKQKKKGNLEELDKQYYKMRHSVSSRDSKLVPTTLLNSISYQIVCSTCEAEFLAGQTDSALLQNYSQLDEGFTDIGLQVWCRRHDGNVAHIDFEGNTLQTDFRCLENKK